MFLKWSVYSQNANPAAIYSPGSTPPSMYSSSHAVPRSSSGATRKWTRLLFIDASLFSSFGPAQKNMFDAQKTVWQYKQPAFFNLGAKHAEMEAYCVWCTYDNIQINKVSSYSYNDNMQLLSKLHSSLIKSEGITNKTNN